MRKTSAWLLAAATAAALGACSQPTPEERVAEMRANYEAELQNFVVREVPMPGAEPLDGPLGDDYTAGALEPAPAAPAPAPPPAAGEPGEEGEDGFEEIVPLQQNVLLDILIRNKNKGTPLPGLTLEVAQLGAGGITPGQPMTWDEIESSPQRKQTWRIYVDTSTIGRGPGTSVTHLLEDVAGYEPEDGFVVTVRNPVPPAERGEYREFTEAQ